MDAARQELRARVEQPASQDNLRHVSGALQPLLQTLGHIDLTRSSAPPAPLVCRDSVIKVGAGHTTEVVPSPASISCDLDSSTIILEVGCPTDMYRRIVAPSLVIITSPPAVWICTAQEEPVTTSHEIVCIEL